MNGIVTIPTVSIPNSFAAAAMMGAAPVPVPPPIPAVIKTILVSLERNSLISLILSIAAFFPTSGIEPAPLPCVRVLPSCTLKGTGDISKAWESVLHTIKSTPLTPWRNM